MTLGWDQNRHGQHPFLFNHSLSQPTPGLSSLSRVPKVRFSSPTSKTLIKQGRKQMYIKTIYRKGWKSDGIFEYEPKWISSWQPCKQCEGNVGTRASFIKHRSWCHRLPFLPQVPHLLPYFILLGWGEGCPLVLLSSSSCRFLSRVSSVLASSLSKRVWWEKGEIAYLTVLRGCPRGLMNQMSETFPPYTHTCSSARGTAVGYDIIT